MHREKGKSKALAYIQIDTLPHYGCILLIMNTKRSLYVEQQKPWAKPGKKAL